MSKEKIIVMSSKVVNGLEKIEGYIIINNENRYFKLYHDFSVDDYDYSYSDLTEEEIEKYLHINILNENYTIGTEENLYNYLNSALFIDRKSYINKDKEISLNGEKIVIWLNSKGFIHIIRRILIDTNIGKFLADVEFAFSKKKELKEIGYNIIK